MVLASKVLKLVNSAFYHWPQPVGSIRDAVSILGFASLREPGARGLDFEHPALSPVGKAASAYLHVLRRIRMEQS